MNWQGHARLNFIHTLTDNEQEMFRISKVRKSEKFKPQYNEMILSLQYFKLISEENESAEEWMGHLWVKANEF